MDKENFNTTKSDDFYEIMARDIHRINSTLKIDWTKTHWSELDTPLYSALAAKIFARFQNSLHEEHLPPSVGQQANYAFRHFKAPGNQADFIIASEKIEPSKFSIAGNMSFRYIHFTDPFTPKMKANAEPHLF